MVQKLLLGLLVFVLTACAASPTNPVVVPTAIPILTSAPEQPTSTAVMQPTPLGSKQSGDLLVSMFCNNNPPFTGGNMFEVVVSDAGDQPVSDAKITFDADMTNMSHGKNVVEAVSIGEGRYRGKIAFLMPGPWRVIVGIDRAGQKTTTRFDFKVDSK